MDVLGEIFLIHVSLGSIGALEDDAPVASIIWVIWMINVNLGDVSFKFHDLKTAYNIIMGLKYSEAKQVSKHSTNSWGIFMCQHDIKTA